MGWIPDFIQQYIPEDLSKGTGFLADVVRSSVTGSDPRYTYIGKTPEQAAQQSTIDMLQRELPALLNGADVPQLSTTGGFINGLVKMLDDMTFGAASGLTGIAPTGFYTESPNSDVIKQALEQLTQAKLLEYQNKGAVAKRGGAANASPDIYTGQATLADQLVSELAQTKGAKSKEFYSAVGNDISYINKNAAGTQADPSYGNIRSSVPSQTVNPQAIRDAENARIMTNLFGKNWQQAVPPVPRPTMSEAAWLQAKRQQALGRQMQALMPMLELADKMQSQGVELPAEWPSIIGNLEQQQNVMNWRAQQKALGNRT